MVGWCESHDLREVLLFNLSRSEQVIRNDGCLGIKVESLTWHEYVEAFGISTSRSDSNSVSFKISSGDWCLWHCRSHALRKPTATVAIAAHITREVKDKIEKLKHKLIYWLAQTAIGWSTQGETWLYSSYTLLTLACQSNSETSLCGILRSQRHALVGSIHVRGYHVYVST